MKISRPAVTESVTSPSPSPSPPISECVGIIGGGQLARMLAEAAIALKIRYRIYAQGKGESASFVTRPQDEDQEVIRTGSLTDESAVSEFLSSVNKLTFENEFLDIEFFKRALLKRADAEILDIVPSWSHLARTQDKLAQKDLFRNLKIAAADYIVFETEDALTRWFTGDRGGWGEAILKWSRFGYDGKGNFHVSDRTNLEEARDFYSRGRARGAEIYAEKKVAFQREIAIQACHAKGETVLFPVVVSEQSNGICHRVWGPARAWGVDEATESTLQGFARDLAREFGLEGTFAIEAFAMPDGSLLANEIAPRVHNTGHATQSVCDHSQFDLHLRAVMGWTLPHPKTTTPFFAMLNILGPKRASELSRLSQLFSRACVSVEQPLIPGVETAVSWYDKEPRTGRKLGHINFWSDQQNALKLAVEKWEDWIYHG